MKKVAIVAVYGTLREGFGNHDRYLADQAKFLGLDTVRGYDMHDLGGFPAVTPGSGTVVVELYAVNAQTLADLDRLEGHPSFYTRTPVVAVSGRAAEMYVITNPARVMPRPLIKSGDYTAARRPLVSPPGR